MIEHDVFLDDPLQRQALSYLLDGLFDANDGIGLQQRARNLSEEPFMHALPAAQRSMVALLAVKRAHDAMDDVFVMSVLV